MHMKFHRTRSSALLLALASACGGGGGSGSGLTPPSGLVYDMDDLVAATRVAVAPVVPQVQGTVDAWSITPALPEGLVLDPDTGAISGTPLTAWPRTTYTVVAANEDGEASFTFDLLVVDPARFAFVTSDNDDTISSLALDYSNGNLVRRGLAASEAGETGPEQLVLHPRGRFAFTPNFATDNLTTWAVDTASSALTKIDVDKLGAGPHYVAVHPNGRWVYSADAAADEVIGFEFDEAEGQLIPIAVDVATGRRPIAMAFDRLGRFVFVANGGMEATGHGSSLQAYAIAPNADLQPVGQPFKLLGGKPTTLVCDPNRDALYIALDTYDGVASLRYSPKTGAFQVGQFRAAGDGVAALAVHPQRPMLYSLAARENVLRTFAVDESTLRLTATSVLGAGTEPVDMILDPTGSSLYTLARGSQELKSWTIDKQSNPVPVTSFALRGAPKHITAVVGDHPTEWQPRFVHVTAEESAEVSAFTIGTDGAVTLSGVVSQPGERPSSVVLDPTLRLAFVANQAGGSIARYSVGADGALKTLGAPLVVDGVVRSLTNELSGRFLYAVTENLGTGIGKLHAWSYDATTGTCTELGAIDTVASPRWVGVDPTSEFLYVASAGSQTDGSASIGVYRTDSRTGVPSASAAPLTLATAPANLGFHPSGRWLYAPLPNANAVARFQIRRTDGALEVQADSATSYADEPVAVTFSAEGQWAYVACRGGLGQGLVARHAVNAEGSLEAATWSSTAGSKPTALSVAPGSSLLYALNEGGDDMTPYQIQAQDGTLLNLPNVLVGLKPSGISVTSVTQ